MRSHKPVKPGLIDPDLSCPRCGLGKIQHIDGGSWKLNKPKPHYLCFACLYEFHIPLPRVPAMFRLWGSA